MTSGFDPATVSTAMDAGASRELRSILEALAHAPDWPLEDAPLEVVPGDRIGRYALERVIGRGGFGVVFAARDEALGRRVAIKVTRASPTPDVLERFEHEGRIAAQLNHPNLVTLHDSGTIEGLPFLVLELLDGETLAARVKRGPLAPADALAIAADVARALVPVHAAGIVHLDLKPSNVFLTADGRVKVLDFGLAQLRDRHDGRRAGTPGYMAPEQATGATTDARADVYALGVMIAEMAGRGAAPAAIRALCDRATAADPAERFADAPALLAAIDAVRVRAKRMRRWLVGAGLIAVAIAGAVVVQVRAHRQTESAARTAERAGREAVAIAAELREARLEPLHDIRPDEQRARVRLEQLADAIAGGDGGDAAEIALAGAERALRELTRARHRLEAVIDRDRGSAAVAALGEVMLDQYVLDAHDASLDADPELRASELARADQTLRAPALRELDEAGATTPLALARIALAERRYADARKLAAEVLAARPGDYETDVLIGDAYGFEATAAEQHGDERGVLAATAHAGVAFEQAATIARSDPAVYARLCWNHATEMRAHIQLDDDAVAQAYSDAAAACARALEALPDDPETVGDAAQLRVWRARALTERELDPDAVAVLAEGLALVAHARAAHPDSSPLAEDEAMLVMTRAYVENKHGDPRPSYAAAARAYIDAWRLRPAGDASDRLGELQSAVAEWEVEHGVDPREAIDRGLSLMRHRDTAPILDSVGRILDARAQWQIAHGEDPRKALDEAVGAFEQVRTLRPNDTQAIDEEGAAWQLRAEWESRQGLDPIPSLDRAIACTDALLALDKDDIGGLNNMADELAARADAERQRGGDGWPFLTRAIATAERAHALGPNAPSPLANLAQEHQTAAHWLVAAGKDPSAEVAASRDASAKSNGARRDDLFLMPVACDLDVDVAHWQQHVHQAAAAAVSLARAKDECARAIAIDPQSTVLQEKQAAVVRELASAKN